MKRTKKNQITITLINKAGSFSRLLKGFVRREAERIDIWFSFLHQEFPDEKPHGSVFKKDYPCHGAVLRQKRAPGSGLYLFNIRTRGI
jgi:hypothetical protein